MQFVTRAYNECYIDQERNVFVKKSKNERLKDEIDYYKNIPEQLKKHFPKFIASSYKDDYHILELEIFPHNNLGQYILSNDSRLDLWKIICHNLKNILTDFKNIKRPDSHNPKENIYKMLVKKTEDEYKNLLSNDVFAKISKHNAIHINNKTHNSFDSIWPKIKRYIEEKIINDNYENMIHGDLCFSNILCDDYGNLKLVDMRGSFGDKGIFGNSLYDKMKLAHSCDGGYEYIIYDKFSLSTHHDYTEFDIQYYNDTHKTEIENLFNEILDINSLDILVAQGVIFIGLIARHYENLQHQLAFYCIGMQLLNKALEQIQS